MKSQRTVRQFGYVFSAEMLNWVDVEKHVKNNLETRGWKLAHLRQTGQKDGLSAYVAHAVFLGKQKVKHITLAAWNDELRFSVPISKG